MELKLFFSIVWISLAIWAFWHYYYSIIKWNTKPHIYTWLIFSLILTPSFFIQSQHWWWLWTYVLLVELIWCFITFLLAIHYWEKQITKLDKIFLLWAIITIIMWLILDQPIVSTVLIIMIDFFALLPTYRKTWNKPFDETIVMYIISGLIFFSSLLAIEQYNFLTTWHQIAIILFDWGLVLYILVRRKILS